jgi:hypothetical protein
MHTKPKLTEGQNFGFKLFLPSPVKAQKPSIPKNAPAETVWCGGPIEWFKITFRVSGTDLIPSEITQILGCKSDQETEKGKEVFGQDGTFRRVARHGSWHLILKPEDTDEWDCGEAAMELVKRLPSDVEIVKSLSSRYKIDFFIGLKMTSKNKGFSISPKVMTYLGERGVAIGFDVYYEGEFEK